MIVKDSNDNSPVLHNSDLNHLSVSEDSAIGTVITVLSATDADDGGIIISDLLTFMDFFYSYVYLTQYIMLTNSRNI